MKFKLIAFAIPDQKRVAINRIVQHQLDKPVRVQDPLQTTECDFLMLSNETEEFKEYFTEDKIKFDSDYWMSIFDQQEDQKNTHDNQKRGFKNGHADLGFGRDGVSRSAEISQKGRKNVLFAIPHLIHKDKFDYKKLGNIPDQIQLLADKYIQDNGQVRHIISFCLGNRLGNRLGKSSSDEFLTSLRTKSSSNKPSYQVFEK